MTDTRTAWYRHRAEEEGAQVALELLLAQDGSPRQLSELYLYRRAREAAHYANLALGPFRGVCRTCGDTGFVAYWDGSAYAGEGCPDCSSGPTPEA